MASQIDVILSIITTLDGVRQQWNSPVVPLISIEGSGDPSTPNGVERIALVSDTFRVIYDYERNGGFDIAVVVPKVDGTLFWQSGTPADGDGTKANLVWDSARVRAGYPFVFPGDGSRCNAVAESHAADSGDEPLAVSDSGEVDGRIWLIGFLPDDDGVLEFVRRN